MMHRNTSFTRLNIIPEFIYAEAEKRAMVLPVHHNSHRGIQANQIGCLGEVIAERWMSKQGINFTSQLHQTKYDYLVNNNITLEIKTKDRRVTPLFYYDNSAPLYNHAHQRPDYFLFISLERNSRDETDDSSFIRRFKIAYIVGSISYDELDRVGIPFLKDEKDWRNDTKFWTDCLNIEMWQLIPLSETIEILRGQRNKPSQDARVNKKVVDKMKSLIASGELKPRNLPRY